MADERSPTIMLGRWAPVLITVVGVVAFAIVCVGAWWDAGWTMRAFVICSGLCVAGAVGFALNGSLGKSGASNAKRPVPRL